MLPTLNQILFMIGTLFGLDNTFIASETRLTIEPAKNNITIEYVDLQVTEQSLPTIEVELEELTNATTLDPMVPKGITLISKSFQHTENGLNAYIQLTYKDLESLSYFTGFNFSLENNSAIDYTEKFYYELLRDENYVKSNGAKKKGRKYTSVSWKPKEKKIQLQLSRNKNSGSWMDYKYSVEN